MQLFIKYYLPIYLLLFFSVVFLVPTYRTWKQTGINPVTFDKEDTAHNYIGFVMKLLIGLLFGVVLFYSFGGMNYQYLLPVWYLEKGWIKITGLIVIHVALVWVIVAQKQMSNSWRIGIDKKNKTKLVTQGVFSISRNPIFLGIILSVAGLFLVLPNAMTFFLTLATYFIIQIQIRLEEEFLERQHEAAYLAYKQKVRRLI